MLSRTGNDGPAGVSGLELTVRSLLESVLPVRPRTNEFLIGHPLLLLGLLWRHRTKGQAKLAPEIMILAGFIGQASIINTFCHLHTPLQVTVIRVGVGLVLGVVGALAAWVALRPFIRQEAQ
jgi:VIT1/CCC1 family predicted Fe2+/Mn2+ transporter